MYVALLILHIVAEYGIDILILALFIRMIASWFRMDERYAFIRFLARLTNPFILPFRRFIRPVGFIDFSYLLAWFLLFTVQIRLKQALL